MSTTISVVCYKSKVLKNNESPLMLRICKEGKRKYESIGISLDPKYWDFKANKPTSKCPNKEYIEKVITEKTKAYTDKILELKAMEKDFTATTLAEKVNNPINAYFGDTHPGISVISTQFVSYKMALGCKSSFHACLL